MGKIIIPYPGSSKVYWFIGEFKRQLLGKRAFARALSASDKDNG
jgi:hypothetical protein